mgnify:FL=1
MVNYRSRKGSKKNNKNKHVTKSKRNKSNRGKSKRIRAKRTRKGGIALQMPSKNIQTVSDSFMMNDPRYVAAKYAMNQTNQIATNTLDRVNSSKLVGSTLNASNIVNASKLSSSGVPSSHNQYSTTSISTRLPTTLNGTSYHN